MGQIVNAFLDSCIIIYWVEACDPFYSRMTGKIKNLEKDHPSLKYSFSRLSVLECLVKPIRENDIDIIKRYEDFLNAPDLSVIEISPKIIDSATKLRAAYNLRTPDAIQAASALSLKGDTFFLTGDKSFQKIQGLKTILI